MRAGDILSANGSPAVPVTRNHAFDVVELKPGIRSLGRWVEYDEPAARDAEQKLRAFLAAILGGMPWGDAEK